MEITSYYREMSATLADFLSRFAEAIKSEPIAVAAVCPPAGITVECAISRLCNEAGLSKDDVCISYNPTSTDEPAFLAMYKLERTRMEKALAVECIGKEYVDAKYLCYFVPPLNYQWNRIAKLKAPVYNHTKYTTGFDKGGEK